MYKVCIEAVDWVLHCIDYQGFKALMRENSHFCKVVSKGGFKIQKDNFRQNRVRERLGKVIMTDDLLALYFFTEGIRKSERMKKLQESYSAIPVDWLRQNWCKWFRTLKDPRPWGYALCFDRDQAWAQHVGERLMGRSFFWKPGAVPTHPSRDEEVVLPELPAGVTSFWAFEPRPAETGKTEGNGVPAPPKQREGLLPLTKTDAPVPTVVEDVPLQSLPTSDDADKRRLGDVMRERDQLAKRLRIQEEVHAKALAAKDTAIRELQDRLAECDQSFTGAVEELRAFQEQSLQAQVASFEATALGVHPDLVAFAEEAVYKGGGLRERANQMLARQRENNKRYGTLQTLRDELHKTDQLLTQVRQAVEDAIQPIPGMTDLQRELEKHLAELTTKLHGDTHWELQNEAMQIPARLKSYIIEIPFDDQAMSNYSEVRRFLGSHLGRGLLGPEERDEAMEILERRQTMAANALNRATRLPETVQDEAITGELLQIFQLRNFLNRFADVDLFVDAYNVIKHDVFWAGVETTTKGFQTARADFIAHCQNKAKFFHSMTLVFDSDLPTSAVDNRGNFKLVYAAQRTEGQNADNFLVEELERFATADEENGETHPRWLVTNDMGLRTRVCNLCEAVVDVFAFANFLKNYPSQGGRTK